MKKKTNNKRKRFKKNFHLVSLQDPDLDTKTAARQMKADSSRHKSMHSSLVVAVTCGVLGFSTHPGPHV